MLKSIIGTKVGMTQIFDTTGNCIPVTVVAAGPCVITEIRTKEKNGYNAVQIGFGDVKEKGMTKPLLGQFKKRNIAPKKYVREFRTEEAASFQVGQEIKADVFKAGDYVDVVGVTKGKGFAGVMKRHNFRGGPITHGQSDRQRARGSSSGQGFQRVIKGLRMAGHLGNEYVTIQRLQIVGIDAEKNYILIKGATPGPNKSVLCIEKTVKKVKAPVVVKAAEPKKTGKGKK